MCWGLDGWTNYPKLYEYFPTAESAQAHVEANAPDMPPAENIGIHATD